MEIRQELFPCLCLPYHCMSARTTGVYHSLQLFRGSNSGHLAYTASAFTPHSHLFGLSHVSWSRLCTYIRPPGSRVSGIVLPLPLASRGSPVIIGMGHFLQHGRLGIQTLILTLAHTARTYPLNRPPNHLLGLEF